MLHGPDIADPPILANFEAMTRAHSQIVSVADAAARAALVAGITGISTANPVWVYRHDASAVEVTTDGTTWRSIPIGPTSSVSLSGTYGTGWGAATGTPSVYREGGWAWINGIVARTSGTATTICTLPAGYRPKYTVNIPATAENASSANGPQCWLDISTAGVVTLHQMTGATWDANTWLIIHPTTFKHA